MTQMSSVHRIVRLSGVKTGYPRTVGQYTALLRLDVYANCQKVSAFARSSSSEASPGIGERPELEILPFDSSKYR
jgi:hypothetical protein